MHHVEAPGRTLFAEEFGDRADPTLLLISGITSQLTNWNEELCHAFVDRGFHVVRFDNRDVGLSTIFTDREPYTLSDMADDAVHVIDYFDARPAHVVGMSMGGMIAQVLAAERPDVVASMTSIGSLTGMPGEDTGTPEAIAALLLPEADTREQTIANNLVGKRVWGTEGGWNEEEFAAFCGANWDRSHPKGSGDRQWAAIEAAGDRSDQVRTITVPSLVIHGSADTLIKPEHGRHTAELIGCDFLEIEGMGHDLPMIEWPQIVSAITALAARSYEAGV